VSITSRGRTSAVRGRGPGPGPVTVGHVPPPFADSSALKRLGISIITKQKELESIANCGNGAQCKLCGPGAGRGREEFSQREPLPCEFEPVFQGIEGRRLGRYRPPIGLKSGSNAPELRAAELAHVTWHRGPAADRVAGPGPAGVKMICV
jgi:hypothetical protein